ncbi:hypothetical protein OIE67_38950 [Nonomuraea fuscirosea]|uniref:hypothetical protein n=1 Tax=Nonomuraea fuscirosea TaxID=1291556 RepID=UPI002DD7C187|nr:hypothetical protein [Nonomuraea fuscirosea]WSA50003.1 hypothetical protein OIE67_38950 [Nonomuraea fuscirosea]
MDFAVWLSGLMALAGVGLGGLLSSRAQDRAWKREEQRRWRDARRSTYGDFVAAVRQYRLFVSGPDAAVEVWMHPDGTRLIPAIGPGGADYQTKMEASFTAVQMVAQDQETVNKAHFLASIARRVAVARAVHGPGKVPSDLDESLFTAERDFLNSARRDLGLPDMDEVPFPEALADIDDTLTEAYRRQSQGHRGEPKSL